MRGFQSLTRDSNHSNGNFAHLGQEEQRFQSLTRDSNHSNQDVRLTADCLRSFNPSRGIAIIQTRALATLSIALGLFQSLTRDSNHSNLRGCAGRRP